jgi:hypothetical protein
MHHPCRYAFGEEASAGIQEDICLTLQKLKRAAVKFGARPLWSSSSVDERG